MSGPKRNPDKLNTAAVIVVGICSAVLVYVTIVALQAFYMDDTSEIQTMADYGGNDTTARSVKTTQVGNIGEYGMNPVKPGETPTFRIPIDVAMKHVLEAAKVDPANAVPTQGRPNDDIDAVFGRPAPAAAGSGSATSPAPADGAGSAAPSTDGAGAGSAAPPAGAGSAAPTGAGSAAPPAAAPPAAAPAQGSAQGSAAKGNAP